MNSSNAAVCGRALEAGLLALMVVAAGLPSTALAADAPGLASARPALDLSIGAQFSSGEYGGDRKVEDLYVPVTAWYRTDRYSLRLTVPYLRVDAPAGTIIEGPGGQPIPGDGPNVTESGLGDIILGLTVHDVWMSANHALALDLGGKVKLGTADDDKGLGTGKTDFTFQADIIRFLPSFAAIGTVGYVVRGDPDDFDLDDGFLASIGGIFEVAAGTRLGAFLEYRQAAYEFNDDRFELVGALGWRLFGRPAQAAVSMGLSDSAPDWSIGLSVMAGR